MCGIAGFVGRGSREDLKRMTRALAHRGPDADGHWHDSDRAVYLGHRRLSIIDLSGGGQPMWSADGKIGIVFNGEIYNHAELRVELQSAGCVFQSDHSDTEVLIHAYREWGDAFVDRLNGMWAFVIYDLTRERLFASRDRFGKKPFYYFLRNQTFAFASELTALENHPESPSGLSSLALAKYFAYGLIPAPHSLVRDIWKLPAGHNLEFSIRSRELRIWRYWEFQLEPDESATPPDEYAEELRELLRRAVRRRLVSDVPLGVFLSGGVDSSAIAALATEALGRGNLKTFSIGFHEPTFDESAYARRTADFLGSEHHLETLTLDKTVELLPGLAASLDEPQGDSSILPTWLLSGFTRKHVTVALGGDGGDELFAGYDPIRALRAASFYHSVIPRGLHPAIRWAVSQVPVSHRNLSLDFKLKRFLRGAGYSPAWWLPNWMGALEAKDLTREFSPEEIYSESIQAWDLNPKADLVDRATQYFIRIYLQDGILPKVDRATMLHGLEARSPFLDIDLVNFARRIPSKWKYHRGQTKYILKRALEPLLPREIIYRKKKGFGTPMGAWFQTGKLRFDSPARVSPTLLNARQADHLANRSDERQFLWNAWMLEAWGKSHPAAL